LRFMLDGIQKSGYIASSYEISTDYQQVNCPPPPFYFKVGNEAYLLNELDNMAIRTFQTMAVPGDTEIAKDWQKANFKESGKESSNICLGFIYIIFHVLIFFFLIL